MRPFAMLAVAALAGCGGAAEKAPSAPAEARTYPLTGVVRKVDADGGKVVLKHEEIPGYMKAMTMPFSVKDRAALEGLREGDKVAATLRVMGDHSELTGLEVTEPAAPPTLTLDLSGNGPALREKAPPLEPGQEVPDFAMTTQEGKPLKLSDLRGEVVALTFIYTRCPLPDYCPKMDASFAEVARMVGAVPARVAKVRLLSVSFDPEHDTPEVLARHAALRGAKPPLWRFAVADHAELRKVMEPLGLVYGPRADDIVHNLSTAVIGPDGRLARRFEGSGWSPADVFRAIREAMQE